MPIHTSAQMSANADRAMTWQRAALAIVVLAAIGCGGPMGPFAGGALSGEQGSPAMTDWSVADAYETASFETRPSDPHSVTTWFVSVDEKLYVPTSMILGPKDPTERGWVAHVTEDPRVRIRLGDTVYERVAIRVEDQAEFDATRAALEGKYEIEVEDRDPERTIWIYRLDARSS